MPWWDPRKREVRRGKAYFAALALAGSLLLAAFIVQHDGAGRLPLFNGSFAEVRPDIAAMLPETALYHDGTGAVQLEPLDGKVPSFLAAYALGDALYAVDVRWDARAGEHVVHGQVELGPRVGVSVMTPPEMTAVVTAPGLPAMALLTEESLRGERVVALVTTDDAAGIRIARIVEEHGTERSAEFVVEEGDAFMDPVKVHDVSGDGIPDLVAQDAEDADMVRVYEWRQGSFVFSDRLSWAFATSRRLFPEPPAANAAEIDAAAE
jgi:hypothetical protein